MSFFLTSGFEPSTLYTNAVNNYTVNNYNFVLFIFFLYNIASRLIYFSFWGYPEK